MSLLFYIPTLKFLDKPEVDLYLHGFNFTDGQISQNTP